jgi:predicted 2-oxoglutarate/Fe(II)-dependent dioxygenase YbiX
LDPDHIDAGSTLTLSALLSDPSTLDGGQFLTFSAGAPVAHELECGDAVVFYSERIHNVSAVMSGVRHSLVIELWEGADNVADRHH